ncbi:MAG TPA: hypothetical protein VFH68_07885 [Polyangia bacterium]|nr:hypothetical protein [Polyangia bacterium]
MLAVLLAACGPMVEKAPFPVRPDSVRAADLLGPYDGIVVDADTERPIAGALVAASWAFERGVGFQAPLAAQEVVTETGADGRYQIPRLESLPSGLSTRVRRFTIIVYHRGHVGWRSDRRFPGRLPRRDFSQRGNRVRLEKWLPTLAHAEHLLFLGGGSRIRTAAAWEAQTAVVELEGERGAPISGRPSELPGAPGTQAIPGKAAVAQLDVAHLLTDDEIRGVTGYVGKFEDGKLSDLPTTEFYDSRHFKASGKPESFDVGLRVWRLGSAAAEVQYGKLLGELPGAKAVDEVGDASLRARAGAVSGLAFLVRERGAVVSITCGTSQCTEPGMLLRLAKLVESRLPDLQAPAEPPRPAPALPRLENPDPEAQ